MSKKIVSRNHDPSLRLLSILLLITASIAAAIIVFNYNNIAIEKVREATTMTDELISQSKIQEEISVLPERAANTKSDFTEYIDELLASAGYS